MKTRLFEVTTFATRVLLKTQGGKTSSQGLIFMRATGHIGETLIAILPLLVEPPVTGHDFKLKRRAKDYHYDPKKICVEVGEG
jgi:hypothetical protein